MLTIQTFPSLGQKTNIWFMIVSIDQTDVRHVRRCPMTDKCFDWPFGFGPWWHMVQGFSHNHDSMSWPGMKIRHSTDLGPLVLGHDATWHKAFNSHNSMCWRSDIDSKIAGRHWKTNADLWPVNLVVILSHILWESLGKWQGAIARATAHARGIQFQCWNLCLIQVCCKRNY